MLIRDLAFVIAGAVMGLGLLWGFLATLELVKAPQTLHRTTMRPVWQIHMLQAAVIVLLGIGIALFLGKS